MNIVPYYFCMMFCSSQSCKNRITLLEFKKKKERKKPLKAKTGTCFCWHAKYLVEYPKYTSKIFFLHVFDRIFLLLKELLNILKAGRAKIVTNSRNTFPGNSHAESSPFISQLLQIIYKRPQLTCHILEF